MTEQGLFAKGTRDLFSRRLAGHVLGHPDAEKRDPRSSGITGTRPVMT
jgi:hypothetical protein